MIEFFASYTIAILTIVLIWRYSQTSKQSKPILEAFGFCIPVVILYLSNDVWRAYGDHGLFHASIVHAFAWSAVPPDNPIFGGNTLNYNWGYHFIVFLIGRISNLSVSWTFAFINVVSMLGFVLCLFKMASLLSHKNTDRLFATVFGVYGLSAFSRGPIKEGIEFVQNAAGLRFPLGTYQTLISAKFYNFSANGAAITLFFMLLYFLIRRLKNPADSMYLWTIYIAIFFLFIIVYPPYMLAILFPCFFVFAELIRQRRISEAIKLTVASLTAFALSLPYLFTTVFSQHGSAVSLTHDFNWMVGKSIIVLAGVSIPALVFSANFKLVKKFFGDNPGGRVIAITSVSLCLIFVILSVSQIEYKFLLLGFSLAGFCFGLLFARLNFINNIVKVVLAGLMLIPAWHDIGDIIFGPDWVSPKEIREAGFQFVASDVAEANLVRWIRENTPKDAIVIDTSLNIPVLAHRSLYLGSNIHLSEIANANPGLQRTVADGWEWQPEKFLRQQKSDEALLDRRKSVVEDIFSKATELSADTVEEIRAFNSNPLYIITRNQDLRQKIVRQLDVDIQFESAPRTVFRVANP